MGCKAPDSQGGLRPDGRGPGTQGRRVDFKRKSDQPMAWETVWESGFKKMK